uniref:Uncharacterized protein n=1 Tax=Percolomonas cosmopolitus TaxID=63605 RepID=A0A7S1KQ31_9EUKA|mmetsp:Transcript_4726/g.17745  ORF Transcript_4726/g.17745 Transcript_4726/m.17745 type:complete len:124 (+) Transcript_4726:164-535(+)
MLLVACNELSSHSRGDEATLLWESYAQCAFLLTPPSHMLKQANSQDMHVACGSCALPRTNESPYSMKARVVGSVILSSSVQLLIKIHRHQMQRRTRRWLKLWTNNEMGKIAFHPSGGSGAEML